ncbi:uncharacterized protein [Spinacia oleracea]|uniref:Uncharacterized protein isoform X2 n=1 Tax=Spinacia oleracea TaxID=3562 RepID=A0ABM3QVN8_SPIOL|nr:uncharacterized protein LOC110796019 isoform X2 [Spinacia oleracea]
MAAYTMNSDKVFLRCLDMGEIQVYELDSLYMLPVNGKHWLHLGIIIGPGKKYEALKIGNKEIKGVDLQRLINELFNSRLIVNRVTATLFEVEYYRLFDLFNWSQYQVITIRNTRWVKRGIVDGRPMVIETEQNSSNSNNEDKKKLREKEKELEVEKCKHEGELAEAKSEKEKELREKEKELEEEKRKHEGELAEAKSEKEKELREKEKELEKEKRKHEGELAEAKSEKEKELKKKQEEMDNLVREGYRDRRLDDLKNRKMEKEIRELKRKHTEEEQKKQQELEKKEEEINELKKKEENVDKLKHKHKEELEDCEKELKMYVYMRSDLQGNYIITDFYKNMVHKLQQTLPPSKVVFERSTRVRKYKGHPIREGQSPSIYVPLAPIQSGIKDIKVSYVDPNIPMAFDRNNWRVLHVAEARTYPLSSGFQVYQKHIAYYNGNKYQADAYVGRFYKDNTVSIPAPCSDEHMCAAIHYHDIAHILGVGFRVCLSVNIA